MDIINPERRSALMSRIKGKNTGIELQIRRGLHALGLRYRIDGAGLPGRPDLVLPRYRTAVFVHGCFWHRHDCYLFRLPKTRTAFWKAKIDANSARDNRNAARLRELGWHVETVWECELRNVTEAKRAGAIRTLARRIRSARKG